MRTSASAAPGYVRLLGVVFLLFLLHRQHDRCDTTSDRQFRQVRLRAVFQKAIVVLPKRPPAGVRDDRRRGSFEDPLQLMVVAAR